MFVRLGAKEMIFRLPSPNGLLSVLLIAAIGLIICTSQTCARQAKVPAKPVDLPFVGCPSDGQTGPVAAPAPASIRRPRLPKAPAKALAYYASASLGVIAPRGWHCFGLYGSSGTELIVTPDRHYAADLFSSNSRLPGPAIQLSRSFGGTAGRFEVARVSARLFPVAGDFVRSVMAEDIEPADHFQFEPFPQDTLKRLSPTTVEYVTPANTVGLGTGGRLAKNEQPIRGVVILLPAEDMDLVELDVRLPAKLRNLAPQITRTFWSARKH